MHKLAISPSSADAHEKRAPRRKNEVVDPLTVAGDEDSQQRMERASLSYEASWYVGDPPLWPYGGVLSFLRSGWRAHLVARNEHAEILVSTARSGSAETVTPTSGRVGVTVQANRE